MSLVRRLAFTSQIPRLRPSTRLSVHLRRPDPPRFGAVTSTPYIRTNMSSSKAAKEVGENEQKNAKEIPFIVKFYDPDVAAKDARGRTLEAMLEWEDSKLEHKHDYIQVWFPLPEGSPFNWAAPVIDKETCSAFRSRPELRTGLQKAFTRIIKFYGFEASYKGEEVHIYRSINPIPAFRNWVVRLDHNHLRITRVIRSLRVLGLEQNAQAFYKAIQDVNRDFPDRIGKRSMMYWERAAVRRLALAPDESDETVKGQSFLRELDEAIKETETVAETEAVVETKAVAETEAVEETKVTEETKAAEETKDA